MKICEQCFETTICLFARKGLDDKAAAFRRVCPSSGSNLGKQASLPTRAYLGVGPFVGKHFYTCIAGSSGHLSKRFVCNLKIILPMRQYIDRNILQPFLPPGVMCAI